MEITEKIISIMVRSGYGGSAILFGRDTRNGWEEYAELVPGETPAEITARAFDYVLTELCYEVGRRISLVINRHEQLINLYDVDQILASFDPAYLSDMRHEYCNGGWRHHGASKEVDYNLSYRIRLIQKREAEKDLPEFLNAKRDFMEPLVNPETGEKISWAELDQ